MFCLIFSSGADDHLHHCGVWVTIDSYRFLDFATRQVMKAWAARMERGANPFMPLAKPLRECTLALVSTAGVARNDDRPFDQDGERRNPWWGDPTFRAQALLIASSGFIQNLPKRIVSLAAKARLPAIYHNSQLALAGGLMSYATDYGEQFRGAAGYVGRILKGEKPADLAVQQPTKFEFLINLKTAKALGIKFPGSILVQATKVIE
jgi:hypothetical protein